MKGLTKENKEKPGSRSSNEKLEHCRRKEYRNKTELKERQLVNYLLNY